MKTAFIIGATGVFGSRLVQQIATTRCCDKVILAGRNAGKTEPLLKLCRLAGIEAEFKYFDRAAPDPSVIKQISPSVIIDVAGPFQGSSFAIAEAAIASSAHYIDIADARAFVKSIPSLNDAARAANVAVISGASSTPALSHAALDHLVKDWQVIQSVLVAISPSNRAPRGLSVIEAILSYVGKPMSLFQNGARTSARGWSQNQRIIIPQIGSRNVTLCETPDLDELCRRYHPVTSAEFKAGLELGVMHHALRLFSFLRLKNLPRYATLFLKLAELLKPFGTDHGGMLVEATGKDQNGAPIKTRWSLSAKGGVGPNVPILPVVVLLQNLDQLKTGARSAAGEVALLSLVPHFERLGITKQIEVTFYPRENLFQKALGKNWNTIPAITRAIHETAPTLLLQGEANVEGATTLMGRILARGFGFAKPGQNQPLRTIIIRDGDKENWARHFPGRVMQSVMRNPNPDDQTIEEGFGPFRIKLFLKTSPEGIDMIPVAMTVFGLKLPLVLVPKVKAIERASPDGKHLFDVEISYPLFGRLVHYRGWLEPAQTKRLP
ncbi:MAG: DUF4166 domain-containing protein [Alphaproteobacteria bacterium]|nr:DUF4166 domain-containing protein [Alphaproteobacteria bacterium]